MVAAAAVETSAVLRRGLWPNNPVGDVTEIGFTCKSLTAMLT